MSDITELVQGQLRLGAISCHRLGLPRLLSAFASQYPGVEMKLLSDSSESLLSAPRDGALDAAVVSFDPNHEFVGLSTSVLETNALAVAVPPGHELSDHHSVGLAELGTYPLITLPRGSGTRRQLDSASAASGVRLKVALETDSLEAVAELTRQGIGVGLLPEGEVPHHEGLIGVRITPLLTVAVVLGGGATVR